MLTTVAGAERFSETHWKSLRYFSLYRCAVATLLFFAALLYPSAFPVSIAHQGLPHLALAGLYLASAVLAVVLAYRHRQGYSMQLTASVLVDVVVMTLLIHVGGGLGSGEGPETKRPNLESIIRKTLKTAGLETHHVAAINSETLRAAAAAFGG